MQKQLTLLFLYIAITQPCLPMHQLARPALIQTSAAISAITPQLQNRLRNYATNSSTPTSQTETTKTATDETDVAQLLQQLLQEQKKQTELLREIKAQDDSFFASFISRRTMLWFMTCTICFSVSDSLSSIKYKLEHSNERLNSINNKLNTPNNRLEIYA